MKSLGTPETAESRETAETAETLVTRGEHRKYMIGRGLASPCDRLLTVPQLCLKITVLGIFVAVHLIATGGYLSQALFGTTWDSGCQVWEVLEGGNHWLKRLKRCTDGRKGPLLTSGPQHYWASRSCPRSLFWRGNGNGTAGSIFFQRFSSSRSRSISLTGSGLEKR